ncbi:MAG TPA: AlkA N-terminal domain-containing protein [Thermoanaerobaculia bacterium]|nr:AlkA N-terminal domain-containing protein [Thermoanaerobaculia bacterium]
MKAQQPFDFDAVLTWLGARAIPGIERIEAGTYIRGDVRVWRESGEVRTTGDEARVRRLFDLDFDPAPMHALFARDEMLAPLLAKRPGVRVPGAWDPFELAVRAIVGQQVSVAGARTILGRIAAEHGFDPAGLAEVTLTGMPRKRAETIQRVARAVRDGEVKLEVRGGEDDLTSALTAIQGIGPWTANYIAMRLGDRDAFPAGDLILRRNAGNLTERELSKRAEAWRPFRAYAAMLLWMG